MQREIAGGDDGIKADVHNAEIEFRGWFNTRVVFRVEIRLLGDSGVGKDKIDARGRLEDGFEGGC